MVFTLPVTMMLGKSPEELMGDYSTPLLRESVHSEDKDTSGWRSVSGGSDKEAR